MTDREQFDAFFATTSPLESTEATAFACWCAARSADEALMRDAMNELEFYTTTKAIEVAAKLRARLEKEGTT